MTDRWDAFTKREWTNIHHALRVRHAAKTAERMGLGA